MNHPALEAAKTRMVDISRLITSEAMQPRSRVNPDAIQRYRMLWKSSDKAPFPPIITAQLTDPQEGERGRLLVVDGFHRVAAARDANVKKISAKVLEITRAEAEWLAVQANAAHGVPLSKRDHREAFRRYMRAGANVAEDGSLKSYRTISKDLGGMRSHQTFARWMQEMYPEVAARMGDRDLRPNEEEDVADNAEFMEGRFRDQMAGARRTAGEMLKAQRKAVEQAPRNAAKTDTEKARRAAELTRGALLGELHGLLETVGAAVGLGDAELLEAMREAREARLNGDF